jgi:predicted O-linked N-acetylglucosamine transferase (SPINDLY family)
MAALWELALDAQKKGFYVQAEGLYRKLLEAEPENFDALHMLGIVSHEIGKSSEAEKFFLKALSIDSSHPPLFHHYGLFLAKAKRYDESVAQFDQALKLFDRFAPVYCDRGIALTELGKLDEALESHNAAVQLAPNVPMAFYNRANTLFKRRNLPLALQDYDRAVALNPNYADAHCGRGNVLQELRRPGEALAAYDRALALAPKTAEARLGRGNLYRDAGRHEEALVEYGLASSLKPDLPGIQGDAFYARLQVCEWLGYEQDRTQLIFSVRRGELVTSPFPFLAFSSAPKDQLQCARLWASDKNSDTGRSVWQGPRYRHDRIRVGYLSADFRQHAVASLIAGTFDCHDKSRFEITGLSIGADDGSDLGRRVKASFEHFVDAGNRSDDEIAKAIMDAEIDILVDLMGLTAYARPGILMRRPAPIQVNYLGFPGTVAAQYIDYILADKTVIPEDRREFYAEEVVYLPDSFMPADRDRPTSQKTFTRAEAGLPEQGFVFCCFNNSYKITPAVFAIWMRLLKEIDGSMLWLFAANPAVERNLRKEAAERHVDAERLIFAPFMPLPEHQVRQRHADLFLDTLPYNAGATASDALWAGVPVVTRIGESFAGRMAASLLTAVGLPELITTTTQDYETLALTLARQPNKLAEIKRKLEQNRLSAPLFGTRLFATHIEQAFAGMWQRWQQGEPPQGFTVGDLVNGSRGVESKPLTRMS